MDTLTFQVGDNVNWIYVTTSGSGASFSERKGVIVSLGKSVATVKMRNGRKTVVLLSKLRLNGKRHALTEAFQALAAAPLKKGGE